MFCLFVKLSIYHLFLLVIIIGLTIHTCLLVILHMLIIFHVLGPPGKPKGPLEVVDIQKDSITVAWKPPEDDGGRPVT